MQGEIIGFQLFEDVGVDGRTKLIAQGRKYTAESAAHELRELMLRQRPEAKFTVLPMYAK
jgi:hypothetical protein